MSKKGKASSKHPIPGNTLEEQRIFDEMVVGAGRAWLSLVSELHRMDRAGLAVQRVTLKGRWVTNGSLLVVLVADGEEGPVVAFHQAEDPITLPRGLLQRLQTGKLKWRPDEYA